MEKGGVAVTVSRLECRSSLRKEFSPRASFTGRLSLDPNFKVTRPKFCDSHSNVKTRPVPGASHRSNAMKLDSFPVAKSLPVWSLVLGLLAILTPESAAWAARAVPDFNLTDVAGHNYQLQRAEGRAVVLFFTGTGCPIARKSVGKLKQMKKRFGSQGVEFWVINTYADDSLEAIAKEVNELGLHRVTYLRDPQQRVALALGVERTAEVVAVGAQDWKVFYQGAIDDQFAAGAERPAPQNRYLEAALGEFLAGQPVTTARVPAQGCRITYASAGEPGGMPSYAREIAPLLQEHCIVCHREGGIGPWAMDGHGRVRNNAAMIEEVLLTGRMPPWPADPGIGRFANEHRLSREQTQTVLRWVAAGAPRGDGPDPLAEPLPPLPSWQLGTPDVVIRLPEVQQIPATGVLEYRDIAIAQPFTNDVYIAAMDIKPGNGRVVHHAILYAQWPGCPDSGTGKGVHLYGWA
ncbi:MAG: hypothetical protein RIS76_1398, partial [Verrucomicrobiota bacterium]